MTVDHQSRRKNLPARPTSVKVAVAVGAEAEAHIEKTQVGAIIIIIIDNIDIVMRHQKTISILLPVSCFPLSSSFIVYLLFLSLGVKKPEVSAVSAKTEEKKPEEKEEEDIYGELPVDQEITNGKSNVRLQPHSAADPQLVSISVLFAAKLAEFASHEKSFVHNEMALGKRPVVGKILLLYLPFDLLQEVSF